jgi:cysteine sulfinate desulfinase/cysteine desulfurase-like protein
MGEVAMRAMRFSLGRKRTHDEVEALVDGL